MPSAPYRGIADTEGVYARLIAGDTEGVRGGGIMRIRAQESVAAEGLPLKRAGIRGKFREAQMVADFGKGRFANGSRWGDLRLFDLSSGGTLDGLRNRLFVYLNPSTY